LLTDQKRLKIIYLIGELSKGGSERQLYLLLTHMNLERVQPIVVVFNPSINKGYCKALIEAGIEVVDIPADKKRIFQRVGFLVRLFRKVKPQIVHSWSVHDNPYASLAGWLGDVPLRLGSLRCSINNHNFKGLHPILQKISLRSCQDIFVNAPSIKKELIGLKIPEEKIILLNNCVEIFEKPSGNISDLIAIPSRVKNPRVVGTVGNLRKNKNIHIFIKGLAEVLPDYEDLYGVIIGQPISDELDYYERIKALIANQNLGDRIFLMGFREDAPRLIHQFSIFCLLSDNEGTPNVVLEAMAAAKPVIASNTSGIPDVVRDCENGILITPGNVNEFEKALRQLLDNPDLAVKMGQAGLRTVVSEYDCEETTDLLLDKYDQLRKYKQRD